MNKRHNTILLAVLIAIGTIFTYWPALHNEFVWDDLQYVLENTSIRETDLQFFKWTFTQFYAGNWHPLTWISHAFDIRLWGLDPWGHHLVNILLHALNTIIVFFLVIRLCRHDISRSSGNEGATIHQEWRPLIAAGATALLFGVHPAHVESVAWVAERKDLLCALFFLLSIFVYLRAEDRDLNRGGDKKSKLEFMTRSYLTSFGLFLLALLSKPMAVTLPVVLLILDWYPLRRVGSLKTLQKAIVEKTPFLICSLASSIITILAQRSAGALSMSSVPVTTRFLVGARALTVYLEQLIIPRDFSPFYPYPKDVELLSADYLLPLVFLALIAGATISLMKNKPLYLSAWGYFVITLVPVLGIIQVGQQAMADRYIYLPSIGLFVLFGLGITHIYYKESLQVKGHRALMAILVVVACSATTFLVVRTGAQIHVWRNSLSLWDNVIQNQPASAVAFNNRGTAYAAGDKDELAIEDYSRAVAVDPEYYEAYNNIGIEYGKLGLLEKAIEAFDHAVALAPASLDAHINRGTAYVIAGDYDKALKDFNTSIRLNPRISQAYLNRGKLYESSGDRGRAFADFQSACQTGESEACNILQSLTSGNTFLDSNAKGLP